MKGASAERAQKALAGRKAVVAHDADGFVVVFDEELEDQNEELLDELAAFLSEECQSGVMAFLNHDDSILMYVLYNCGVRKDSYNSNPGYFDDGPSEPASGNSLALCEVFNCRDRAAVQKVLKATAGEDYVFESERHAELARLLGLPEWIVGFGFTQIANGELPDDSEEIELLWTKDLKQASAGEPGYYKVVIRNPTPGEEPISMPVGWLPATWEKLRAEEADLSERDRRVIAAIGKSFETLGLRCIGFQRFLDNLNPKFVDGGGAFYVNESGEIVGQIAYIVYAGAFKEIESISCTFRATFNSEILVCTNQKPSVLANPPNLTILVEDTPDPLALFDRFLAEYRGRAGPPKKFPSLESVAAQFNLDASVTLEERVRKGQYVLMNPFEVWRAKKALIAAAEGRGGNL